MDNLRDDEAFYWAGMKNYKKINTILLIYNDYRHGMKYFYVYVAV